MSQRFFTIARKVERLLTNGIRTGRLDNFAVSVIPFSVETFRRSHGPFGRTITIDSCTFCSWTVSWAFWADVKCCRVWARRLSNGRICAKNRPRASKNTSTKTKRPRMERSPRALWVDRTHLTKHLRRAWTVCHKGTCFRCLIHVYLCFVLRDLELLFRTENYLDISTHP